MEAVQIAAKAQASIEAQEISAAASQLSQEELQLPAAKKPAILIPPSE